MNTPTPLLFDSPDTRQSLRQLACRLTSHQLWHEDLVQEALIHIWREEQSHPGRSWTWYLRSCEYRMRNVLRHGRSIDSLKRRPSNGGGLDGVHGGNGHASENDSLLALGDSSEESAVVESVITRDLISKLISWLTDQERDVLACLMQGLAIRETARTLKVSHTMILKRKRRIMEAFARLVTQ